MTEIAKPSDFKDLIGHFPGKELNAALDLPEDSNQASVIRSRVMNADGAIPPTYWISLVETCKERGIPLDYPDLCNMWTEREAAKRLARGS
jgi:hypothetical protein